MTPRHAALVLTAALATPLSAQDPHGMRTWQLVLLERGPKYGTVEGAERQAAMKGHMDNIGRLARLGKLRLAGPFAVPKDAPADAAAGLFLFDVKTREEAVKLCDTDPAVKAGVFTARVMTWYGPSDITYRGDEHRPRHPDTPAAGKAVSLFSGHDLGGWHVDVPSADGKENPPPSFEARDGMLVSLGKPPGHLITDAVHANYRLVVEWRWPGKPGNCGVLVHASKPRRLYGMFPQSLEVQLHRGNAGDFWCIGEDITVPGMVERRGPKEKWGVDGRKNRRIRNLTDGSEKPLGEWNTMVIECRGGRVDVWVNGDYVNGGDGCTAQKGQIAIQAEGAECHFRKVELTPLVPMPN